MFKWAFLFLFAFCLKVSAKGYSQDNRVSLDIRNMEFKKVLSLLEKKGKIHFLYSNESIPVGKEVSLTVKDAPVLDVLQQVLENTGLKFKAMNEELVVIAPVGSEISNITVKGKISDESGHALAGVSVVVEGTKIGVVTNASGEYEINVPENGRLVFTYVGYISQTIAVNGKTGIDVVLQPTLTSLSDVVVVGYGTQKRTDVTGSITTISSDQIKSIPVTDVAKALEGKVAGLNITQSNAIPGTSPSIMIRGQNSISAGNSPLIVIDGVPFSGGFSDINQNDIADISVLKGPSATAIYGTRGSNGVILITTKKGKTGKARIAYNGYVGRGGLSHKLKPASPQAYLDKWKWYQLETNVPQDQLTPVPNSPGGYEYQNYTAGNTVDWLDEVTQPSYITDNNITISGATNTVNYYISGEFLKQQGAVKGYQFTRNNIRANIDANLTDYLDLGANLSYNANNYDGGQANLLMAEEMSPYGSLYGSNGKYTQWPMYPELLYTNPLLPLYRDRLSRYKRLDGRGYIVFKPEFIGKGLDLLKGLQYRLNASYSYDPSRNATYEGRDAGSTTNGSADLNYTNDYNWLIENILSWKRNFGDHHIDFTGLYSAQKFSHFYSSAHASGFINDLLSYNNLAAGSSQSAGSNAYAYTLVSQMARINYSYKSTYLLTLTARRDGFSAFGANTSKYALFPTIAAGWNISNESFMRGIQAINDLKLRLSYGKTGNEAVSPNLTTTTDTTVLYPFNGLSTVGTIPHVLGNADLQWESSTTFNFGIDFSLLEDRIRGSIDLYSTDTKGLLLKRHLPSVTGYSSVWTNLGETTNKGLEITLGTTNIKTANFSWSSDITFATNRNRIVDLYGDKKSDLGNVWFIGHPINTIYDYRMQGVWQTSEATDAAAFNAKPGDLKFADVGGVDGKPDGKITSDDKAILGSPDPKWTGGIINTFSYKAFSLRVFIQTVQGVLKNNQMLNWVDLAGRRNIPAGLSYWTPDNNNNSLPALSYTNTIGYGYPSNGSFTRLKDITLTYSLPKRALDKTGLGGLSVYLSGTNLYTWTPWFGWDPEVYYAPRGWTGATTNFPLERSFVLGLNLSLR